MSMEQRCNVCYKVYPSMIELGIHLDYPYNCYLCDKSFALSGHLKNHTKNHIQCESLFTKNVGETTESYEKSRTPIKRKQDMRGGRREGSGRKPLGGEQANGASRELLKNYKKDNKLKNKKQIPQERHHRCSQCENAFYKSHHLKRHMAIHNNLKPFTE